MNPVYAGLGTSIFEEMSAAARAAGAINLGQGFPDADGPLAIRQAAARALAERSNQYPPMTGLPELRRAVAGWYGRHQGLGIAADEVLVTSGATEAIAAALLAILSPGDEVLLVEPMYDAYLPLVRRAGGTARLLRLEPPEWRLTADALAAAITPATRALVLNDPLNPAARAFSPAEVALVARACVAHDLVAICDEVWEAVLFDGRRHHPLMAEPGMAGRTVKIGSAGKMFALTGWKVGWAIAAPELLAPIARAHQWLAFATPPALQWAVAEALADHGDVPAALCAGYERARDRLAGALARDGWATLPAEGTYFLLVDLATSGVAQDDLAFCRRIVAAHGVAAIPLSPFHAGEAPPRHLVRLCFAKGDDTLDEAARRLAEARN